MLSCLAIDIHCMHDLHVFRLLGLPVKPDLGNKMRPPRIQATIGKEDGWGTALEEEERKEVNGDCMVLT